MTCRRVTESISHKQVAIKLLEHWGSRVGLGSDHFWFAVYPFWLLPTRTVRRFRLAAKPPSAMLRASASEACLSETFFQPGMAAAGA